MPVASFTIETPSIQPKPIRSVDIRAVERNAAVGLIRNFLVAIELEGGAHTPFMKFARARAERELILWGEPLTEGGAA